MSFPASTLMGRCVQLEPLVEAHREPLRDAADDERIWRFTTMIARGPEFDRFFDEALAAQAAGTRIPFAVRRLTDDTLVGSTSYLDVMPRNKRVEIGWTWYRPDVWATVVNPECKLLLLTNAFEVLGVNRVSLVTDRLNERSQAAIAKLGAVREGILRSHMVVQGGRIRDSVIFSIIAAEWPAVKERLAARVEAFTPPVEG
jgi:RimJ/RimL family protein N-acetyltransferase